MRLKELHIDGFGAFNDYALADLQPGINILFGDNEAGKTTLLQFIRFTLFGYPRSLEQRLAPFHGGSHGGRIKSLLTDGTEVIFERTAGYPGNIQLHTTGTTSDHPQDWFRLLGHASNDLFENVYAFSLDELIDLESLNRSGVEDKIFSVGLGLKNISINDIEQSLVSQMEAIYIPRGSKQRAIGLLREMETHGREISDIQLHLPQYQELSQNIDRIEKTLQKVKEGLSEQESRHDTLNGYSKCYQSFVIIRDIDRELSTLPEKQEYPEDGLTRLEQIEGEEARLRLQLTALQDDLEAAEKEKPGSYNEVLADSVEEIEKLSLNLEKYKSCAEECREDRLALENLNQLIQQRIAAIHAERTEKTILAFTDMLTHRDRIAALTHRMETLQKNQDRFDDRINLLKARRSPVNMQNVCLLVGQALVVGAAPLIIFKNYLWGTVLMLIAIILIAGRKLLKMEDPLKEAQQASIWMEADKATALNEYKQYVGDELGLSPDLSPEAVKETLQLIEQAGPDIITRDRLQDRVLEKEKYILTFESGLENLAQVSTGKTLEPDKALLASRILREHKDALALKNRALQKNNELERIRDGQKKSGQAILQLEGQVERLLATIQAPNRDDFKKKYRDNNRVEILVEQRRQALRTIEQIAGVHDSKNVIDYLSTTGKPVLEKELRLAEKNLQALKDEQDELNRQISADLTLREQLRTSSSLTEVMTRMASCRENLNRCHREWLAAGIAHHVLQQVKRQYEQKKQPAIIRNSSNFFQQITNGRYQRIQVSLEDSQVLVFDDNNAAKRIGQLSRGTREQLLISIRLGFIEEYEKKAEALPLVLDDVLVNFDQDRSRQTAAILHNFSTQRQALLFTCHPQTRELFQGLPVNYITI